MDRTAYTLAEIRNGTGWPTSTRFYAVEEGPTRPPLPVFPEEEDIVCPSCQAVGSIRHVEQVEAMRTVECWSSDGTLLIDGSYETNDEPVPASAYLACIYCVAEFAVPEKVSWV